MTAELTHAGGMRIKIILAFAAVYIIWGSTYLGIRWGVETIPPFILAGSRFLGAGLLLYIWARMRGAPRPSPDEWKRTAIVGLALLFVANGGVSWAEQRVPSGISALLAGTVPMWFVLFEWLWHGGKRPNRLMTAGLIAGLVGLVYLIGPDQLFGRKSLDLAGIGVLLIASLSWTAGSLYAKKARIRSPQLLATAMQMLAGGAALSVAALATGEFGEFHPSVVTARSWLSLLYLMVFGSIIAFTAYAWLLRVVAPSRIATYAYVNPVIAIILGWSLGGEELTSHLFGAAAIIIVGVILIITSQSARTRAEAPPMRAPSLQPAGEKNPVGR